MRSSRRCQNVQQTQTVSGNTPISCLFSSNFLFDNCSTGNRRVKLLSDLVAASRTAEANGYRGSCLAKGRRELVDEITEQPGEHHGDVSERSTVSVYVAKFQPTMWSTRVQYCKYYYPIALDIMSCYATLLTSKMHTCTADAADRLSSGLTEELRRVLFRL